MTCDSILRPSASIAIVGAAPTAYDARTNAPFSGVEGRVLDDALREAALSRADVSLLFLSRFRPPRDTFAALRQDVIATEVARLRAELRRLRPSVIVALGPEVAHALVPEWPDARAGRDLVHRGNIKRATDMENRRGYVFDSPFGPVVASMSLGAVISGWTPWRVLLTQDLRKAKRIASDGLVRPTRDVEIVANARDARHALDALGRHRVLAADIETWGDSSLACIGFAGESGKAYVFPANYLDRASKLLGSPRVTTVWANGIYDLFVLKHREGVEIRCGIEDAQVAWHAAYPELAGKKENSKRHKMSRKSLAFLASLCTTDPWWKGDYETEEEFFVYNGRDCCVTFDVWRFVQEEVKKMNAAATYEHERALMMPCVDMLARGLHVDEALRSAREATLATEAERVKEAANADLREFLESKREELEALGALGLFEEVDPTCPCCRHASKKQARCWSCAGFESAPSKAALVERFKITTKMTKAEAEEAFLGTCAVCGGAPRASRLVLNPNSDTQMKVLLYDVLKIPKRFGRNPKGESVLKADEGTLKGILGGLPT